MTMRSDILQQAQAIRASMDAAAVPVVTQRQHGIRILAEEEINIERVRY